MKTFIFPLVLASVSIVCVVVLYKISDASSISGFEAVAILGLLAVAYLLKKPD